MGKAFSSWKVGLEADINPDDVYRQFRLLLEKHLPMTQDELANKLKRNRTTISKWKADSSSEWRAGLDQQKDVTRVVRLRVERIERKLRRVEDMIRALEDLETAQHEHEEGFGPDTVEKLKKANERVRQLLKPSGTKSPGPA